MRWKVSSAIKKLFNWNYVRKTLSTGIKCTADLRSIGIPFQTVDTAKMPGQFLLQTQPADQTTGNLKTPLVFSANISSFAGSGQRHSPVFPFWSQYHILFYKFKLRSYNTIMKMQTGFINDKISQTANRIIKLSRSAAELY